jgi:predicted acyl esterase
VVALLLDEGPVMITASVDPASVSQARYTLQFERDLDVPMRDGLRLKADVFRPKEPGRFPVIMTFGPYPKDERIDYGDKAEESGQYMHWESANPEWWVPRGYVEIRVDMRGSGKSPGYCEIVSHHEAEDYYDAIEWAGHQPWSNGNVGLLGISYFAQNQWLVAGLQPPSLKAMIPWEGWADVYRDCAYHGGIFAEKFFKYWFWERVVKRTLGENTKGWEKQFAPFYTDLQEHELFDENYWGRVAEWDKVQVPFLSAGNWGGGGLHLRGNTEAFVRAASPHKRLRMHTGTHIAPFYRMEGRLDQMRFFDYWLKGMQNGLEQDPPVKLAIRVSKDEEYWRFENEWPIARTQWTKFHLDAASGTLDAGSAPAREASLAYSAQGPRSGEFRGASFVTAPLSENTEVTGPIALVVWVSSSSGDMDIFATLRNIAPDGREVTFPEGYALPFPVSKGWLRASHRKLDPALSTPYRPYFTHDEIRKLAPGEIVKVEVEILPTSCVFRKGHRIRLDIQPWDDDPGTRFGHDNSSRWLGENMIHTGGAHASWLLLPIIPARG